MNVFIPLGIILVLITYFSRYNERSSRSAFLFAFIILFGFSAIRYEFGPDYFTYREQFLQLKGLGIDGYLDYNNHFEMGFLVFFNLFNSYFVFIIVHSLIWIGVFYWLFKNNVSYKYLYVVVLMMFINRNLVLLNYVALRSTMASCFFFVGLMCLCSNSIFDDFPILNIITFLKNIKHLNLIVYIALILIGAQFHKTLYGLIIFPFLTNNHKLKKGSEDIVLAVFFVLAFIAPLIITPLTQSLASWIVDISPEDTLDKYAHNVDSISTSGGGLGAIFFNVLKVLVASPIIAALTIENDKKQLRLMRFAIVFLLLMIVIEGNVLARYTICFYPVIIIALLSSYSSVNSQQRLVSLLSFSLLSLYNFYQVAHTTHFVSFLHYQTIFSAPYWQ